MDLDQAVVITNHNDGYTVYYAIADVAAFVEFDAPRAVADESLRRGQTIYLLDQPARLLFLWAIQRIVISMRSI
ncbi:RNB domain-containing ribonuclease [Corynebacterium diphtheriae]|uniref:RNB domain-containing ribonuclease n=1 Tax=Corynebacterium diphtheriae TaxID=1717 RepID=UPI0013CA5439|nr:RNB domain-containing ribonuclease [Corynebacterium diphtheriae]CAB0515199.1 RNB domain-containing ribonuclease [Corynebacterium diphtheriae]CAB0560111.1 RNB domain-containing ribonuclease [Corynebacterium diphtheriae]